MAVLRKIIIVSLDVNGQDIGLAGIKLVIKDVNNGYNRQKT